MNPAPEELSPLSPEVIYRDENPEVNALWSYKYLLYLSGIRAEFDGFTALDIPGMGVKHNELRVVIGPNGAGKTTMCDVISGKTRPAKGRVFYSEEEITGMPEIAIAERGIGRKFQTPSIYEGLSVFENMELALPGPKTPLSSIVFRCTGTQEEKIMNILRRVHLDEHRDTPARSLSHGQRQWLAVSSLMISEPKLLLVDEPAAGLTDRETELTAGLLLELKDHHTIVVIEHDMDFVRRLNSTVTVLNEGRIIAEGSLKDVKKDERVIEAYLGR